MPGNSPPSAALLRTHLLKNGNADAAMSAANPVIDRLLDALNEPNVDGATSLLMRIMVARALLSVTSGWWANMLHMPQPRCHEAMMDIITNPPANWIEVMWDDRTGREL